MIEELCPYCGAIRDHLVVDAGLASWLLECLGCGGEFEIPNPDPAPEEARFPELASLDEGAADIRLSTTPPSADGEPWTGVEPVAWRAVVQADGSLGEPFRVPDPPRRVVAEVFLPPWPGEAHGHAGPPRRQVEQIIQDDDHE